MIRRWIIGLLAGLSAQPAVRAATTKDELEREPIQDVQGQYDDVVYDCRVGSLAKQAYYGPSLKLHGKFMWPGKITRRPGNWRNACHAGCDETAAFIRGRWR